MDGQTDGLMDDQREAITTRQYRVAGYKKNAELYPLLPNLCLP